MHLITGLRRRVRVPHSLAAAALLARRLREGVRGAPAARGGATAARYTPSRYCCASSVARAFFLSLLLMSRTKSPPVKNHTCRPVRFPVVPGQAEAGLVRLRALGAARAPHACLHLRVGAGRAARCLFVQSRRALDPNPNFFKRQEKQSGGVTGVINTHVTGAREFQTSCM